MYSLVYSVSNRKRLYPTLAIALSISLSACMTDNTSNEAPPATSNEPVSKESQLSALPLEKVAKLDVIFAQTALSKLGYKLGVIDGFWGKLSAKAMRDFEQEQNITSADGALSELNLYRLSTVAKVRRTELAQPQQQPSSSLLNKIDQSESVPPLAEAPQLIIIDQEYPVMAKANPFSEIITTLKSETGVYVLGIQGEWFEIEAVSGERGFIKEN